jgi:poly(3-hydroxybutyrate) depolymerase
MRLFAVLVLALSSALLNECRAAERGSPPPAPSEEQVLREGLLMRSSGRGRRQAFRADAIEAAIVAGAWSRPVAGDRVKLPEGEERAWEPVVAAPDGVFTNRISPGGYLYLPVVAEKEKLHILHATAHSLAYVNGEPRGGDIYGNGIMALPIQLHPGTNDLLLVPGRGRLKVHLVAPKAPVIIDLRDTTLPDLVLGEKADAWAAVLVVNSTTNSLTNAWLKVSSSLGPTTETPLLALLPLSTRKVGFRLASRAVRQGDKAAFQIEVWRKQSGRRERLDTAALTVRVRQPEQTRRITFVSEIDGSVQYFALRPARPLSRNHPPLALFLSLHGAAVEATGQADAYSAKSWGHIVAPTNRRPYGFDWEDWGRLDAMEVLDLAQAMLKTDPRQTYLTGHSMGGHGAWQFGVQFPDRFAALGPSAGWISFRSYAGGQTNDPGTALEQLLARAAAPSDTLALASNYLHHGVYILHGEADDNVPVSQARTMREHLGRFHRALPLVGFFR